MKTSRLLPTFALLAVIFACLGCTRNNGDIGPIFGRWALEKIDCSGCSQIEYEGDLFLAFQSDIAMMTQSIADHETYTAHGRYRLNDNTLFLDFSDPQQPVLPAFGLPEQSRLQVAELKSRRLILIYHPTDNSSVQYTFKKW